MKNQILGIVGGMGSHAAVSLFNTVVRKCPASNDREFLEVIVHNNSRIPDRTDAMLYGGVSPLAEISRSVQLLHNQNANNIIMACVTAHHYYDAIKGCVPDANVINLLDVVAKHLSKNYPDVSRIGVIASTGVVRSELWKAKLAAVGIEPLYLSPNDQESYFTEAIYGQNGIKRGFLEEPRARLLEAGQILIDAGAQAILSSCSELPLVMSQKDFNVPFVDSFDILTDYVIDLCYEPCQAG